MTLRMEHANLTVHDPEAMIRFLQTAFPEFRIRHQGVNDNGRCWIHVGTDETYLALNEADVDTKHSGRTLYGGEPGINHLAYEVDDARAIQQRMEAAGYENSSPTNDHPHRIRVYFLDPEGNEWEFVQYLTEDRRLRHDYEIPEKPKATSA